MIQWIRQFNQANAQTKYFILNWVIYGLAIIISTLYCYGRLDFVRSYQSPSSIRAQQAPTVQAPPENK